MRIYFAVFAFLFIGCNTDSTDFPSPKNQQIYKHKVSGGLIQIMGVGSGKYLKIKAADMDYLMSGRIIRPNKNYTPRIIYDPENNDEKCIVYPKFTQGIDFEWHIITVEELAQNYVLVPADSLKLPDVE